MAAELVSDATNDKLTEMDWTKNIEICEIVAHDHRQAKDVVKAIKKRLASKSPNAQLLAVMLLEMLMNNIGEPVHRQVMDAGLLPILVKIVKKKSDLPVREKIFLLLDAAQTSVGGASGRFPQYYSAYSELVPQAQSMEKIFLLLDAAQTSVGGASGRFPQYYSAYSELVNAGLQYPQPLRTTPIPQTTSNVIKNNPPDKETAAPQPDSRVVQAQPKNVSDSSILQKAGTALEVLRDVLNTVDNRRPEAAKDEFTLDLVEQCSFQKNRVMHLAITSRDEKTVSRALELNEQLEKVLRRHDDLIAGRPLSISNHIHHDQEEEEEEEQLIRRIRKGKACMQSEDEDHQIDRSLGLLRHRVPPELVHRPLIRPLTLEPRQETILSPNTESKQESARPVDVELRQDPIHGKQAVAIPPPPSKHVERERFFQENKGDSSALNGHMEGLSLHSRNASSSCSGSIDLSD